MSTTNHGPANHDDDLRRALRDLVDDASLPRLDAHLDVVRGRTRRRRAAKKAALGATTLCVAGALGVAAISLPQGLRPEPVAPAESPSPSATPEAVEPLDGALTPVCGEDLSGLAATTTPLRLAPSGAERSPLDLVNTGDASLMVTSTGFAALYLLDAQGKVASASAMPEPAQVLDLAPGEAGAIQPANVAACDGASLPPAGTHSAVGLLSAEIATDEGTEQSTVVGGPWIVTTDDTGRVTSIAGHAVGEAPTTSPSPSAHDEAGADAEPNPAPVVVRDVLGGVDQMPFEALTRAAATGAVATVDLTFVVNFDWQIVEVEERAGGWRLTLPEKSMDLGRPRTTSDDTWSLDVHGGVLFSDFVTSWPTTLLVEASPWSYNRLVGTYTVTYDAMGDVPTFTLRVVDGGAPATAPDTKDEEICAAIEAAAATSPGTLPRQMETDLRYLADHPVPDGQNGRYAEIHSRWIASPRIWWAMDHHASKLRSTGLPVEDSWLFKVC